MGGLLDLGWILFDPRKQALHDKAAKTVVVNARLRVEFLSLSEGKSAAYGV
ncbi:hypothetical protein [Nonomuraea sp. NPDC049158]|uniref:hypothetical protein n=1 Tax=Nonomuraea sp. NPDC049158 TaxID=3155649 RepID=UPI0033FD500F